MSRIERQNALGGETSPYLLQHADNPVDWYPWSPEALARAREEDKPILLSIGYSACHWCHVMAHESFEDQATAELMNNYFINIKVDREERPDLDKIYQIAHQLLTGRPGGWPLTMFLTPDDQRPFFGGTYFPKQPRFGMPPFREVLAKVALFLREHRTDIDRQNASLVQALERLSPSSETSQAELNATPLDAARRELQKSFDEKYGGFGGAPKFPHPTNLERLLRHYAATATAGQADEAALAMAAFTLRKMALGGIYDQVGGGFCRYSVDQYWMIPHFEKMLYDNGPLLTLCAEAWQITHDSLFQRAALETGQWVLNEMQSPQGGYYSTLDADSEGEEGKYYLWTPDAMRSLLTDDEYNVVAMRFGLDRPPNFEESAWHLHVFHDVPTLSQRLGLDQATIGRRLASARDKLYRARETRIRPGRDEKVLTAWNGLMIKGMATAGRILNEPRFIDSATEALDFVRTTVWIDGRLRATYKDGRARLNAYLDDYAFLIDAVLTLLQARWRQGELEFAMALAEVLLAQFQDEENGGFYFTANDHEALIHRPKPFMDDALPAGNGIAAYALGRLGHLLGEVRYLEAAERTLRAGWNAVREYPHAHTAMLLALEEYLYPPQTIVLRAESQALESWQARCQQGYAPRRLTFAIPSGTEPLPGLLAERAPRQEAVAYVCEGHQCSAPIGELSELETALATDLPVRRPHGVAIS
ncbi:MAG: thioredoxin domain-containing protein [Gammaproteobacteria bacterium]